MHGNYDEAVAAQRQAYDEGWIGFWRLYLRHDPVLEPLHDRPDYQAIVAAMEAKMAGQLQNVREMEARGEVVLIPPELTP